MFSVYVMLWTSPLTDLARFQYQFSHLERTLFFFFLEI